MTDFLDALEQQLLAAHRTRRRRRFVTPTRRQGVAALAAATTLAAVVVAVLALASPGAKHQAAAPKPAAPQATTAPPLARARVTVTILNGTTVTGLARAVADRLTQAGYKEGTVTNDERATARAASEVRYERAHRAAGLDVARLLGIGRSRVRPMGATARVEADRAQIVVFVGTDAAR